MFVVAVSWVRFALFPTTVIMPLASAAIEVTNFVAEVVQEAGNTPLTSIAFDD